MYTTTQNKWSNTVSVKYMLCPNISCDNPGNWHTTSEKVEQIKSREKITVLAEAIISREISKLLLLGTIEFSITHSKLRKDSILIFSLIIV